MGIVDRPGETPPVIPGPWMVFVILSEQQQQIAPSRVATLVQSLGGGILIPTTIRVTAPIPQ
jgi:hypothetical protein